MAGMSFNGTAINDSPTIVDKAGAEIKSGPFTALAYKDGALVACDAAAIPMGITTAETEETVAAGEDITIQVKEIGLRKAGGEFAKDAALSSDENGCAVAAEAGKFVLAFALQEATAEGQLVRVQIVKAGYAPAA